MTEMIAEYRPTEAVLHDLRERFRGATYDVATTDGMREAKRARAEVRQWRLDLEKARKEKKARVLAESQAIDGQARELKRRLLEIEEPIDKQIKDEERRVEREKAEKARREAERVAAIKDRISEIERCPLGMVNCDSAAIALAITSLQEMQIVGAFDEFEDEASTVHVESLAKLRDLFAKTKQLEEQGAELARVRAEQEERDRQERERLLQEARERAEAEAASRRKIEEQEREARLRIEEAERADRERRRKIDEEQRAARERQAAEEKAARDKAEAEAKAEREAREAEERERARITAELDDLTMVLYTVVSRFGHREDLSAVISAINDWLAQRSEEEPF